MVNQEKEYTTLFSPVYLWKSGVNTIVKLWPRMRANSWKSGRKGRSEKLAKVG